MSHPMTVDELWRLPRVGNPRTAPDGRHAVVPVTTYDMDANEGVTRLWLVPLEGGDPRVLTSASESASQPAWSPDGHSLAFVRKPGGSAGAGGLKPRFPDQPQLYLMRLDGGEAERLTDLPLGVLDPRFLPGGRRLAFVARLLAEAPTVEGSAELAKARAEDPVKALVTENRVYRYWDRWLTDGQVHHLFVLDLDSRAMVDLTPGMARWLDLFEPERKYDISPDGREIAFPANLSDPPYSPLVWGVFTVQVPADIRPDAPPPPPAPLPGLPEGHAGRPVYSPDGRYIVYGHQHEIDFYADRERLVAYDRVSGRHTELTDAWDGSAGAWTFGEDPDRVYLTAEVAGRNGIFALDLPAALADPATARPRELVRGGWLGEPEVAGGRIVSTYQSLTQPPEVWTCALDGSGGYLATRFTAPLLADLDLGAVREETFTGAEGEPVQLWLVYPPGTEPPAPGTRPVQPLPLVHLIHGGPHGAFGDQWHWRWCPHVVAAPGYLVCLVNFHGSTGFGEAFTKSILGQWGDRPFADIMAATELLVTRGAADPARLAATGGSYGGYLVSWIAGHTDRFACLINHAGVSDFQTQHATDVTQGRRRSFGGDLVAQTAVMDHSNPLRYAAAFKSPMLVIHGQRDYRVPYNQGLALYNLYQAQGLPSRLVVYPDENHWILKPKNSRHWYGEFLAWLARWLGGGSG